MYKNHRFNRFTGFALLCGIAVPSAGRAQIPFGNPNPLQVGNPNPLQKPLNANFFPNQTPLPPGAFANPQQGFNNSPGGNLQFLPRRNGGYLGNHPGHANGGMNGYSGFGASTYGAYGNYGRPLSSNLQPHWGTVYSAGSNSFGGGYNPYGGNIHFLGPVGPVVGMNNSWNPWGNPWNTPPAPSIGIGPFGPTLTGPKLPGQGLGGPQFP